jgi:azurin
MKLLKFSIITLTALVAVACSREIPESQLPPKAVEITVNDEMKYDVSAFEVKPGQKVQLTFKNTGKLPKETMGHEIAVLAWNTDAAKFVEDGLAHPETGFIAPEQQAKVLAHTKLLGPGESDTITFTAPGIPASYDYVCTFPGHFASGMKGRMTVAY